jgi:hypothetical protein
LRERLRELTNATDAYLVYESRPPKVEINHRGKLFEIIFSTSISESHSSHAGIRIQSGDNIVVRSSSASIDELLAVKSEIEQLLSILCIGTFVAQNVTLRRGDVDIWAKLLWRLGQDEDVKSTERLACAITIVEAPWPHPTEPG